MYENQGTDAVPDELMQVFRPSEALAGSASPDRPSLFGTVRPAATTVLGVAHVRPGGPAGSCLRPAEPRVGPAAEVTGAGAIGGRIGAGTPGFWERHRGGDELLLVLAGHATFTARAGERSQVLDVAAGDVLRIAAGVGHTATIHEPLDVLFLLPEEGNDTWTEPSAEPL